MSSVITPRTDEYKFTGQPVRLPVQGDFALDPGGPFFNFVLTYLAASAGLTPVYDRGHYPDFMKGVAGQFPGIEVTAKINLAECVDLVRAGRLPQQQAEVSLCCMLVNSAFESITRSDQARLAGDPVFEVLRHVRNAASHGNKWYFFNHEPNSPAAWKRIVLDHTRQGSANPLQGQPCIYVSVEPADLLYLLQDVESLLRKLAVGRP